jgi:pentafunctional AROM polypeptide
MSTLPIIWTVRSKGQGGAFAGTEEEMMALLKLGVRLGSDFVDVEGCWSTKAKQAILEDKRGARVITSYHDFTDKCYTAEALSKVFKGLHCGGAADVVKIAIKTSKPSQITEMDYAILSFRDANPSTPAVGLCMGAAGKLSRVSNKFLTFSTHPLLPGKAAPGQLTAEEIRTLKIELGMLPAEVRLRGREGGRGTEADREKCLMIHTNITYIRVCMLVRR